MFKKPLPILLILSLAFALRIYRLAEIPPGLTHDEANHGIEAIGILNGIWRLYFPLGYGREPLYSYLLAAEMTIWGRNLFALRYLTVLLGVLAIAATYRWARIAFDGLTALVAAALLAVSFWPLVVSRQVLRSGVLPLLVVGAVLFFWAITTAERKTANVTNKRVMRWLTIGFALFVAGTLYTYLAARVFWLLFPAFLLYLGLFHRDTFRSAWAPTLIGLGLAGLMAAPMFAYLAAHPELETRLQALSGPLQAMGDGNLLPFLANARNSLAAFVVPGTGDQFLAYNIPGRPVLDVLTGSFFVAGFLICLWRWRRPAYAFVLLWFILGILPSLITGPAANTTRNVAALSAAYLLPAVGFTSTLRWNVTRFPARRHFLILVVAGVWLLLVTWGTVRDYFGRWGESPAVRGAYQHTLVAALDYLEQTDSNAPVVVSSVYPGPAHDPTIGQLLLPELGFEMRWVDARYALLFPLGANGRILIPASTPIHPALARFLQPIDSITLRPDDLDPGFTFYELDAAPLARIESGASAEIVNFDNAVTLRAAYWLEPEVRAGETAELLTIWQVTDPTRVGPLVAPAFTPDVAIFTHVLDETGAILAQRDALDAPAWDWQPGDVIAQIHPVLIPPATLPGLYQAVAGLYDRASGERRPVISDDGAVMDTRAFVTPLQVVSP